MSLFIYFSSDYNKIQNYHHIYFLSLTMDILSATFGYFFKHKKSSQNFMLQMQILHNFIIPFLLLNICHHNSKIMAKGIAYIGSIMM
jgi:hypothetical protein